MGLFYWWDISVVEVIRENSSSQHVKQNGVLLLLKVLVFVPNVFRLFVYVVFFSNSSNFLWQMFHYM